MRLLLTLLCLAAAVDGRAADSPIAGVVTKAKQPVTVDGALSEWDGAFALPLNATHPDLSNRAAHAYCLWDDMALYIGLRTLDSTPAHIAGDRALYDGDAIEFYLDTRAGADLGGAAFGPGTLHMFFTALTGRDLKPRYAVRELAAFKDLKLQGVEMAAARTATGYTLEFKLPWSNFPGFTPKAGLPIGIDVELCSSDGANRVFRTFAFSSPESVQTPSAFGRVKLVDTLDDKELPDYSRALMPVDAQIPGNYGWVHVNACLSPTISRKIAVVGTRLVDGTGRVRKAANAKFTTVAEHWTFARSEMETFDVPPGAYTLLVTAFANGGATLANRTLKLTIPP